MEPLDPNTCPACGNHGTLQELGRRSTWQPVKFKLDKTGDLEAEDYMEWDYGDDVEVTGFSCRDCMAEWATGEALRDAMKIRHALLALTGAADAFEASLKVIAFTREVNEVRALLATPLEVPS